MFSLSRIDPGQLIHLNAPLGLNLACSAILYLLFGTEIPDCREQQSGGFRLGVLLGEDFHGVRDFSQDFFGLSLLTF